VTNATEAQNHGEGFTPVLVYRVTAKRPTLLKKTRYSAATPVKC
jgi:hypothetical protein